MSFHHDFAEAVSGSDFCLICVGTPAQPSGSADLSALWATVARLEALAGELPTVVIRSTVPPGTSDRVADRLRGRADVLYAPEFLREGSAVYDFLHPDRTVVGGDEIEGMVPFVRIFEPLGGRVMMTKRRNAELIKGCANAFLAMKISFANEVANLCDAIGSDADDVLRGIGYDRRIGFDFLAPGIGFGGPCFEKDCKSLAYVARSVGVRHELVGATLRVNEHQPYRIVDVLEAQLGTLRGKTIGVWGLAFKAGTDDIRDSLALRILPELSRRGANVRAFDPAVQVAAVPDGCALVPTPLDAADADALLVLTEWPVFTTIDPLAVAARLRSRIVVDGRNVLDHERYDAAGLHYTGVGRNSYETEPELDLGLLEAV